MVNGVSKMDRFIRYPFLSWLLIHAMFFALYASIGFMLLHLGMIHPSLMFFSEKALLVLHGIPPRLENFGFIYPPLPILIACLFNGNVLLAQGFVASLITTAIVFHIRKSTPTLRQAFPLTVFVTFSFPVLFLATQRFDLYLYFFLVVLSAKFLYQYKNEGYSLHLFLAGPLFGAAFFTHFSAIYLLPLFFFLIYYLYGGQPKKMMAVSMTFFTPSLVSLFVFSYINFMFTGEAFGFLIKHNMLFSNLNIAILISSGTVFEDLKYMLKYVLMIVPAIIPFFWGTFYDRNVVLILPFLIILSLFYSALFFPTIYFSAIFIIHFLLMTRWHEPFKQKVFLFVLGVSLLSSPLIALSSSDSYEKGVAHAFFRSPQEGNTDPYKKMAALLNDTEGKILLDDVNGYPLVYLMEKPARFILPYQFEFATALSMPDRFVDYIVAWKDRSNDLIFQRFGPNSIEQFQKLFEDKKVIIWRRIT